MIKNSANTSTLLIALSSMMGSDLMPRNKKNTINHKEVLKEYDLIIKKKSKMSAAKRKQIVDYVEGLNK